MTLYNGTLTQIWSKHAVPFESPGQARQSAPTLPMQGFDFVSSVGGGVSRGFTHKTHPEDSHAKPHGTTSTPRRQIILGRWWVLHLPTLSKGALVRRTLVTCVVAMYHVSESAAIWEYFKPWL